MKLPAQTLRAMIDSGEIGTDYQPNAVQPASVDLHLRGECSHLVIADDTDYVDPVTGDWHGIGANRNCWWTMTMPDHGLVLNPGELFLLATREWVKIPHDCVGELWGKSTLARWGVGVHVTAGYLDPGFEGHVTLEVFALRTSALLTPGMPIGQLALTRLEATTDAPYGACGNHYQSQAGPQPPKPMRWEKEAAK